MKNKVGYFWMNEVHSLISLPPRPLTLPYAGQVKHCPAIRDGIKNMYEILCPYDINLKFDSFDELGNCNLTLNRHGSSLRDSAFDTFIYIMPVERWMDKKKPLIQLHIQLCFVSDKRGSTLELTPAYMNYNTNPTRGVCTLLRYYDWIRPIQYAVEWCDTTKPIIFKRGDPLAYVKFNEDVELREIPATDQLMKIMNRNLEAKEFINHLSDHVMMMAGRTRPKHLMP